MAALLADENHLYVPVRTTFDEQTGYILSHVDRVDFGYPGIPVRYQKKTFQARQELHITVISKDAGNILKHLKRHPGDADDIQDLVLSTDWSFYKLNRFYLVQEGPEAETIIQPQAETIIQPQAETIIQPQAETIIQIVEIPALQFFLRDLSRLVGQGFMMPLTHITLYMRGTENEIPIPDQYRFQQLAKVQIQVWEVRLDKAPPSRPSPA
jgi:hypothetical protein